MVRLGKNRDYEQGQERSISSSVILDRRGDRFALAIELERRGLGGGGEISGRRAMDTRTP